MIRELFLSMEHWEAMRSCVDRAAPLEACGLLAGKESRVEKVIEIQNQERGRTRFVMDPLEQFKAFEWIESNGLDLLCIFDSHPAGPETVSPTDVAQAAYSVVHMVWSRNGEEWQARGFWIEDGQVSGVDLTVA